MSSQTQNEGTESGKSDTSRTERTGERNAPIDEWSDRPSANHVNSEGETGGTLLGPTQSKKFNDASGFVSEGRVETKKMDESGEDYTLLRSLHPRSEQEHSIETIMSRPVKISTVVFSTQQAPGQLIGTYDVINTIRTNSRFRLLREKLSSFYGIHMTAHLKVTLNAQPMESGLFQIFFIPFFRTEGSVVDPAQFTSNYESMLPYSTGCPNIPCNISKQSEVELAMPYTGPVAFINLTNANSDFGTFFIQTIVPITDSTNAASCEMSVYMYFTNIQLFGTTPNNVIAQPQGITEAINTLKPTEMMEDQMKKTTGALTGGSELGNSLCSVLNTLGLSAPDANPNTSRMTINPYGSPATVDTTATALKVSYMFNHHLDIGQLGVNNKVDEMDLNTIAGKPCYFNQFSWNTSQDAESLLYSYRVEPNCVIKNASNVVSPTRFRFVANNFRYWRGTIRFLFLVVANQYHSGRLRFVYSLGGAIPGTPADNYPRTFTQVVDIRKGAHFIVDCPFFASTPWRLIPQRWNDANNIFVDTDSGSLDDTVAMLQVFVENELRATQTTSSSIQIVCFQSSGSDFEFACPIAPRTRPYINAAVPDGDEAAVAEPQGLDFMPLNMASGLSATQPTQTQPYRFTVGEKVTSVRQLIKRYQLLGAGNLTAGTTYIIYPFAITRPEGVPTLSYDMLAVFSSLYQFRRGSIRFLITTNAFDASFFLRYDPELGVADTPTIAAERPMGDVAPIRAVTSFPSGVNLDQQNLTCTIPFKNNLQGGMEVEFPYYSRFHKLKTAVFSRDNINGQYAGMIREGRVPAGLAFFTVQGTISSSAMSTSQIYRSAADDFTLGYLLGAPLCMYRDRL